MLKTWDVTKEPEPPADGASNLRWITRHGAAAGRGQQNKGLAKALIARADALRDERCYREASVLYGEALRLRPDEAAIQIQCAHMLKEAGDLAGAERHYLQAKRLTPDDSDLALQLGHFYKVAGRLKDAERAYGLASRLRPGWTEPARELAALHEAGWGAKTAPQIDEIEADIVGAGRRLSQAAIHEEIASEILPRDVRDMLQDSRDSLSLRRLGRAERSRWGTVPTLRGVEAIRGFSVSSGPILEIQAFVNGLPIHRGPVSGPFELQYERDKDRVRKYVFNIWYDFSNFAVGRYELELRLVRPTDVLSHRETVRIAEPLAEADFPASDSVISADAADHAPLEQQINSRPSTVRSAERSPLANPVAKVLVLRTDQLGDLVASVPALKRLRELLPKTELVGLVTPGNADLARTLDLFDELIVIDFPDDLYERKRIMTAEAQLELRDRLHAYGFDIAIDLAESAMSRPLLLLSGAKYLCGFYDREWPWLDAGFEAATHDPRNGRETAPHSTRVLALVERLGALIRSRAEVVRRESLSRVRLRALGIGGDERFAVMHTGARIPFSRWPHYGELAAKLLEHTDLKVVLLTDDAGVRASLSPDLLASDRFSLVDRRLEFDDLDALLSYCDLFVGNDSGPKHLAALRGAKVISIHSARVNWSEWGQELSGLIVSRKVPCAGCALYHDIDECGKDYVCVTRISTQEVFDAAMGLIG